MSACGLVFFNTDVKNSAIPRIDRVKRNVEHIATEIQKIRHFVRSIVSAGMWDPREKRIFPIHDCTHIVNISLVLLFRLKRFRFFFLYYYYYLNYTANYNASPVCVYCIVRETKTAFLAAVSENGERTITIK